MTKIPIHILIADDEDLIRNSLSRFIARRGHVVHTAVNGIEALGILKDKKVDLIILDLLMPEKNGFDVLKEMGLFLPVIVISAFSGPLEVDIHSDMYPQVIGFIKKPFENLQTLVDQVEDKYENYIRKV
ncbi:MAG: response regulator [Bdellovibrionaceae bacterium]|nr:response regulator [Pseudobdellovibrionaceae bacterium]